MYDLQLTWTLSLTVETPMHLGTGDELLVASRIGAPLAVANANDKNTRRLAVVQRGAGRRPYIPGSSLKGALRALDPLADDPVGKALWGDIKSTGGGNMGLLTVYGAEADGEPVSLEGVATETTIEGWTDTFAAAHVAIDPSTGAADEHKLFFREMTVPGVRFMPRTVLRLGRAEPTPLEEEAIARARTILGRLRTHGLRLGSGSADADGRLSVDVGAAEIRVWKDGDWTDGSGAETEPFRVQGAQADWTLDLYCEGPFMIMDGVQRTSGKTPQDDRTGTVHLMALALPSDGVNADKPRPWTPGSSLTGALRSRLAWLASLDHLRNVADPEAAGAAEAARKTGKEAAKALFGSEKQRARLRLIDIKTSAAHSKDMTSVSLDRFSAAPMEGALFTSRTYVGVKLTASFALDPATGNQSAQGFDDEKLTALLGLLSADMKANGLQLGSGGAKGFGWFNVRNGGDGDV